MIAVACWVTTDGHTKSFVGPQGAVGQPHWDLYLGSSPLNAMDHLLAHSLDQAVERIREWWRVPSRIALEPLRPDGIDDLRALARARAKIRTIAALARAEGRPVGDALRFALDPPDPQLAPDNMRRRIDETAARVDVERLVLNFPRPRGRAASGTVVLLSRLDEGLETKTSRHPWLVALVRPHEAGVLEVQRLIGVNARHRWDVAPWLWDATVAADEETRWGIRDLPVARLGFQDRDRVLAEVSNGSRDPDRAARTLLLLDADRVEEALEAAGVACTDRVRSILSGAATGRDGLHIDQWARFARNIVRKSAPWRFARIVDGTGRKRAHAVAHRLVTLPGQRHLRTASLVLQASAQGPVLAIEDTATNTCVPEALWCRPVDLDLIRFGLE